MRTTVAVLTMVIALTVAGCAGDADDAVEEVDPGIEATIDAPAESAPAEVGEDE